MSAIDQLIKKYKKIIKENSDLEPVGEGCPLCYIFFNWDSQSCKGCPLESELKNPFITKVRGCFEFKSFKALFEYRNVIRIPSKLSRQLLQNRVDFWKYAKPIIEKHPDKHFTVNGWEYFDDLDRRR